MSQTVETFRQRQQAEAINRCCGGCLLALSFGVVAITERGSCTPTLSNGRTPGSCGSSKVTNIGGQVQLWRTINSRKQAGSKAGRKAAPSNLSLT